MRNWAKFSDFILTFLYVIGHCIVEVSVQFTNQRWGSMEIPTRKCHTSALFLFLFSSLIYLSLISLYCFSLSASLWLAFQYHATVALCITMSQELRKKKKKMRLRFRDSICHVSYRSIQILKTSTNEQKKKITCNMRTPRTFTRHFIFLELVLWGKEWATNSISILQSFKL